jgi:hypothetical protein
MAAFQFNCLIALIVLACGITAVWAMIIVLVGKRGDDKLK